MKALIEAFPQQLREALKIFRESNTIIHVEGIQSILITGLGGSGIGGSIVSELVASSCTVPLLVSKDYFIPAWAGDRTLVIVSSYSGNTEETLHAMKAAAERNCRIVCISSGGEVLEMARKAKYPFIQIPGGFAPRACLGYSLVQLCGILESAGQAQGLLNQLEQAAHLIENSALEIKNEAQAIARAISYSVPVIYTSPGYEGIAIRLRQQLNENSKMLCWHHVIPEINHNEQVAWIEKMPKISALFLRNSDEYYRTSKRMDIVRSIVYGFAGRTLDLQSKGQNHTERVIWWIHLGDWISWFASQERNVDADDIKVIIRLKDELSQLQ